MRGYDLDNKIIIDHHHHHLPPPPLQQYCHLCQDEYKYKGYEEDKDKDDDNAYDQHNNSEDGFTYSFINLAKLSEIGKINWTSKYNSVVI